MPRPPPERTRTDREALREALGAGVPLTVRELSKLAGLSEDQVVQHLEHLTKSIKAEGGKLVVEPAECLGCGYVFEGRTRFTKPGKCPECKETRVAPPSVQWVKEES
jgi:predicted Zn-ribbon and HTH transcriptional regulator